MGVVVWSDEGARDWFVAGVVFDSFTELSRPDLMTSLGNCVTELG